MKQSMAGPSSAVNRRAEGNMARRKLSVLELAEALENVSEARRRKELSRQSFRG